MSESDLINGCISNERNAQRELYERYKRAMYTLAYRLTNDFDDANDILQDAFLEVFKNIAQFKKQSTLGAWIKAILIRKAYHKKQKLKLWQLVEELPDNEFVEDWNDNQSNIEQIEKAIAALPDGFRAVFVLIEIEGFAHREVAEMLKISEGTSKSQLFHAKKKLKENLKGLI